ncbi:MAG: DUF5723 family protein [Bacteroidales bacterium]
MGKTKVGIWMILMIWAGNVLAQMPGYTPYFPTSQNNAGWKYNLRAFYSDDANSNHFTNDFFAAVNSSELLTDEMKDDQINNLNGQTFTGRIRQSGLDAWFNSKQKPGSMFYYFGVDFQNVLDSQLDSDLIRILLKGNKPYAGQTLYINNSEYLNQYFNRIKGGVGFYFGSGEVVHAVSAKLALSIGQNYDQVGVSGSSFYTHPEGDYLDLSLHAETQAADTSWGKLTDINGLGVSTDLYYSIQKEKDFYAGICIQNLGFISWSGNPFVASMDSTFRFSGISNDTTGNQDIPTNYSYDNLRRLIFDNPDDSPFTESLPMILNLSAGKFFSEGKFYAGLSAYYYPSLISNYRLEVFGTWNLKDQIRITPIVAFSSYSKINYGLAADWHISEHIILRAGSTYLNSYFSKTAIVGRGGFVSLQFFF